jgi:hypothetical protein
MNIDLGYKQMEQVPAKPEFSEELNKELNIFTNGIIRIEKTKRISAKVDGEWRFIMKYRGKPGIIDITNKDLMSGPKNFNDIYTYTFGIMLPTKLVSKPKKNDPDQTDYWRNFILEINREAVEVEPKESDEWIETDRFISVLAKMHMTEDKKIWADIATNDRCLLKEERDGIIYYCVHQDSIASLKDDLGIKLSIGNLGKALNGRGFKMKSNEKMTGLKNYRPIAWWFYAEVVDELIPPDVHEKREEF